MPGCWLFLIRSLGCVLCRQSILQTYRICLRIHNFTQISKSQICKISPKQTFPNLQNIHIGLGLKWDISKQELFGNWSENWISCIVSGVCFFCLLRKYYFYWLSWNVPRKLASCVNSDACNVGWVSCLWL